MEKYTMSDLMAIANKSNKKPFRVTLTRYYERWCLANRKDPYQSASVLEWAKLDATEELMDEVKRFID